MLSYPIELIDHICRDNAFVPSSIADAAAASISSCSLNVYKYTLLSQCNAPYVLVVRSCFFHFVRFFSHSIFFVCFFLCNQLSLKKKMYELLNYAHTQKAYYVALLLDRS